MSTGAGRMSPVVRTFLRDGTAMPFLRSAALHGRLAALLAASHLLLFAVLPTLHVATAPANHAADNCPICQVLHRPPQATPAAGPPHVLTAPAPTIAAPTMVAEVPIITSPHIIAPRAPPLV
jgi:hypothetical protein